MVKLIILFRAGAHAPRYYEGYHEFLVLLEQLPGIRRKVVSNMYFGSEGIMPFRAIVEAYFDDREALEHALASPIGIQAGRVLIDFAGPDAISLFADVAEATFGSDPPSASA